MLNLEESPISYDVKFHLTYFMMPQSKQINRYSLEFWQSLYDSIQVCYTPLIPSSNH